MIAPPARLRGQQRRYTDACRYGAYFFHRYIPEPDCATVQASVSADTDCNGKLLLIRPRFSVKFNRLPVIAGAFDFGGAILDSCNGDSGPPGCGSDIFAAGPAGETP